MDIVWAPEEKAAGRTESSFPTGLRVERCEVWSSRGNLGTTERKPVQKASLEESPGMWENQEGGRGEREYENESERQTRSRGHPVKPVPPPTAQTQEPIVP